MKKILLVFILLNSFLFSVDVKFNYKINNDELLYKKRIMSEELLNKDFNHIVALKSYLMYNELTASNAFIQFRLKDPLTNSTWTQQFILKQNSAGTPTIFEIQPAHLFQNLDTMIAQEIGNDDTKKANYFLPTGFNYTTVEQFLKYAYSHTLKFVLRDNKDVIQRKINTYGFYLTLDGVGATAIPKISTNNLDSQNMNTQGRTLNTLLFSFKSGFALSKKLPLKDMMEPDVNEPTKPFINKDRFTVNKNLDINFSPSLMSLIKEEDNFLVDFKQETFDEALQQNVTSIRTIQIVDFYIIKSEIELIKD